MPRCWRFTKTPQKDIWTVTVCLSIRMANVTGSIWPASSTFGLLPYLCPASTMLQPHCISTILLSCFYHASTILLPCFHRRLSFGQPVVFTLVPGQWLDIFRLLLVPHGVPVPLFFQCRWGQGGSTWQPFVRSKNGNENFRQARINNFCVKCVVFARNRKFAKLPQ